MLGDLNGWLEIGGGWFRLLGENDDGRRVIDFYAERVLCVGDTYFDHKRTRWSRSNEHGPWCW